jgi:hypothetical protein
MPSTPINPCCFAGTSGHRGSPHKPLFEQLHWHLARPNRLVALALCRLHLTLIEYITANTPALLTVTLVWLNAPSMTPPALPSTDTTGQGSMLGSACLTRALKGRLRGPLSARRGMDADRGSSAFKDESWEHDGRVGAAAGCTVRAG